MAARLRSLDVDLLARIAFALLCAAAVAGLLVYPTYPSYDSLYAMLWAREVWDGVVPSFGAFRAPTPHPLALAVGILLEPIGQDADRVFSALILAAYLALVAGVYRLARVCFTPLIGFAAALLVLSRLDFASIALRGFVDIPFLALLVWAAALEAQRPRRGGAVWVLLGAAGLLRPEAWALALAYAAWCGWKEDWPRRLRFLAYALAAPLAWFAVDLVVTGDPLWSLTYTRKQAGALDRSLPASEVPGAMLRYLERICKAPILAGGVVGVVLAAIYARRRAVMPAVLLAFGIGVYLGIGLAGFSVISRYLLASSLGLVIFCAFALGGFQFTEPSSTLRRGWALGAALLVLVGGAYTLTRLNPGYIRQDLTKRERVRKDLARLFALPAVRAARHCGPTSVPSYKLVPDVRWMLDEGRRGVVDRGDPGARGRARRGVALFVISPGLLKDDAYNPYDRPEDGGLIQVPGPGYQRAASGTYFAVYVRC